MSTAATCSGAVPTTARSSSRSTARTASAASSRRRERKRHPGVSEPRTLVTPDGLRLTAELAPAHGDQARGAMVLCHPHPQFGGSMRSLVISELFAALPAAGLTCIRFDFRGAGSSEGEFDAGDAERLDVRAATRALRDEVGTALPVVLAGWSFGADVALSV